MTFYTSPDGLHNAGVYHRPNGSVVYLDLQYPLNTWCNASIKADADIAGPGTMLSFVVPAIITVVIAALRAILNGLKQNPPNDDTTSSRSSNFLQQFEKSRASIRVRSEDWIEKCNTMLTALCDLQAFTGASIVIAAFMQGAQLSFYHEEMIVRYWWLILDSFWCAQRRAAAKETDALLAAIRKIFVVIAVCFATAFQVRELYRQPKNWSFIDGARCYLYDTRFGYDDRGWNVWSWFALVGTTFYVAALICTFSESMDKSFDAHEEKVNEWTRNAWCHATNEANSFYKRLSGTANYPASSRPFTYFQRFRSIAKILKYCTIASALFVIHQCVAYWSYANGLESIQIVLYTYNVVMETCTLYNLKDWNSALIDGDETSWGFGQCLPMILLSALLFSLGVAFREKHHKTA